MQLPTKIPVTRFTEIENSILKFIQKHKISQITKISLSKKNNMGGIAIPDFKFYSTAIVTKTAWNWYLKTKDM
jgi:hypothetical protein